MIDPDIGDRFVLRGTDAPVLHVMSCTDEDIFTIHSDGFTLHDRMWSREGFKVLMVPLSSEASP